MTEGPGLVGSLLVGITYAKACALPPSVPLIAVNHVEGHIHAVIMEARQSGDAGRVPRPRAGRERRPHASVRSVQRATGTVCSARRATMPRAKPSTKSAKLLGFGYPGGPVIDKLAPYGDPRAVRFTLAKMKGNATDFSFSGLKTAVLRWFEAARHRRRSRAGRRELLRRHPRPSSKNGSR